MPKPEPPAPSNLEFEPVTALAAGLLLYIGICGARLYGRDGTYVSNSLILTVTGVLMLVVIAVWLVLRAILRKDKP